MLERIGAAKAQGVNYNAVIRSILKSNNMRDMLVARGKAVSESAGPGHRVTSKIIGDRWQVSVAAWTVEARVAEAREKKLTKALDAARTGKTKGGY
jgi:hypothetical protein